MFSNVVSSNFTITCSFSVVANEIGYNVTLNHRLTRRKKNFYHFKTRHPSFQLNEGILVKISGTD